MNPRKILCKFDVDIFIKIVSRRGVLGGHLRFLIRDLEDRVILDVMEDVFLPQRRYPESFMWISLLEVCQEWGINKGSLGKR